MDSAFFSSRVVPSPTATTSLRDFLEKLKELHEARSTRKLQHIELEFREHIHHFCEEVLAVAETIAAMIHEDMTNHKQPTQESISDSSRRLSKRKQEQDPLHQPSHSIEPASKKTRWITQSGGFLDELIPSIEKESVLVGFWSADASGNGGRPVYCLVERDFEFAYRKGHTFILVRYDDFDPLDDFGDWLSDDTEDEDAMSPEEVKMWVVVMWESGLYARIQDTILECQRPILGEL